MKGLKLVSALLIIFILISGVVFAAEEVIRGDKLYIFRDLKIDDNTMYYGNVIAIFSNVEVDGMVNGNIISIFDSVNINGAIDGNVVTVFGRVYMGENSSISQNKVQVLGGRASRPSSAIIRGEEVNVNIFDSELSGLAIFILIILILVVFKNIIGFIFSAILVAVIPERMEKITHETTQRIGRRFGIGILGIVIFYTSSAILSIIVIGAPLTIVLGLAYSILGLGGNTAVKLAIGRKFDKQNKWSNMTCLIVGSLIYILVDATLILKPILYFAKIVGMGAIIDTQIGTMSYWNETKFKYDKDAPVYTVVNDNENIKNDENTKDTTKDSNDKINLEK